MTARELLGEQARVNLQEGTGAGVRNSFHKPVGTRIDQVS